MQAKAKGVAWHNSTVSPTKAQSSLPLSARPCDTHCVCFTALCVSSKPPYAKCYFCRITQFSESVEKATVMHVFEDYSWLKNVQFPTLRRLPEALPGKYLTLRTVWPFSFWRISSGNYRFYFVCVRHPPTPLYFFLKNALFHLLTNQLHVINSFPSPSSVVCSACQEFFTPTHPLSAIRFKFNSHGQFQPLLSFFPSKRTLKVVPR